MNPDSSSGPSWGLVLIRIVVGAVLLYAGWIKLQMGIGEELVTSTRERIAEAPDLYRAFAENVVLQHPWFFAQCIVWGELLGGLCLFLGVLTRPAGFASAFLFANFVFAAPAEQRVTAIVLLAACLGCAISRAGRVAGADVFLDGKLPGWITWTRGG
ncbi:MAG: DoxX family membrane protein [Planctomycetes bacterium]|nr:DoxX family membrane protein [Planctomycetota bacterium]